MRRGQCGWEKHERGIGWQEQAHRRIDFRTSFLAAHRLRIHPTDFEHMQRLILVVLLAVVGWYGYGKYQGRSHDSETMSATSVRTAAGSQAPATPGGPFRCDGRTRCSQMTSCDEATFFLKNCPGVKMDGNGDGIPCEKQWCGK